MNSTTSEHATRPPRAPDETRGAHLKTVNLRTPEELERIQARHMRERPEHSRAAPERERESVRERLDREVKSIRERLNSRTQERETGRGGR